MYSIEKIFTFQAAHFLRDYEGDCARLHGHSYSVVLVLSCADDELTEPGFVRPFRDLDLFKKFLDETYDHQLLNDIAPFDRINPTTEHLARHLYLVARTMFPEVAKVRVQETAKTWVEYSEGKPST